MYPGGEDAVGRHGIAGHRADAQNLRRDAPQRTVKPQPLRAHLHHYFPFLAFPFLPSSTSLSP